MLLSILNINIPFINEWQFILCPVEIDFPIRIIAIERIPTFWIFFVGGAGGGDGSIIGKRSKQEKHYRRQESILYKRNICPQ
jgi:hypothetical protein